MSELILGHLGYGTGRVAPFNRIYKKEAYLKAEDIENGANLDTLVIWGGSDISPTLYNHRVAKHCGASYELSKRDEDEASACLAAIERGIPIIGVCRGAQLVCALAGGYLIQHVNHHGRSHKIMTDMDETFLSSSVHHQMMFPFGVDHKLLAWADPAVRSDVHLTEGDVDDPAMEGKPEPEIVWFPKIKALAIQGHPEFHADPDNDPFVQHCLKLVHQYVLGEE